jgi:peroxiredoxin/predicted 2-oxoglutarate/Fe(II)-dependent dioxygenase YbiX
MPSYRNLLPGDSAPWFRAPCTAREEFAIETAGGRYLVLCFFMTASDAKGRGAVAAALEESGLFDEVKAAFFGVSVDPADKALNRVAGRIPGYRIFWDVDGNVSRLYGAIPHDADPTRGNVPLRRIWVVLDPTLRVMRVVPFAEDGSEAGAVMAYLRSLPPPERFAGFEVQAPVLVLTDVFEPKFCEQLIELYDAGDRQETGFMVEVGGKTVQRLDPGHKRRRDHIIDDAEIVRQIKQRFARRVTPQLAKAYQYNATWMERYLVGCYRAEDGGHFAAHRDNTTKGTAHRRFAASVNLNADFDGGELSFPEYGPRGFRPPPGGAVVFSCSLLHSVSRVTRGRRYAFLPFMYDEEAAKLREANQKFLAEDGGGSLPAAQE